MTSTSIPIIAPPDPTPKPTREEFIKSLKSPKVPLSFYNLLSMKTLAAATKTSVEDLFMGSFEGGFFEPEGVVPPPPLDPPSPLKTPPLPPNKIPNLTLVSRKPSPA